jgi:hypothetical protein
MTPIKTRGMQSQPQFRLLKFANSLCADPGSASGSAGKELPETKKRTQRGALVPGDDMRRLIDVSKARAGRTKGFLRGGVR